MRTLALVGLVTLAACAEEPADPSGSIRVDGSFSRLDATDVTSPWVGEERVVVANGRGEVQCEAEIEIEASSREIACAKCSLTLELLDDFADAAACAVDGIGDRAPVLLSFEHEAASSYEGFGTILVADASGEWEEYTVGSLDDGVLSWSYDTRPFVVPELEDTLKGEQTEPVRGRN